MKSGIVTGTGKENIPSRSAMVCVSGTVAIRSDPLASARAAEKPSTVVMTLRLKPRLRSVSSICPRSKPWRQPIDAVNVALNGATFALLIVAAELLAERWIASALLAATGLRTLLALVSRERPKLAQMIPLELLADQSFRTSVIASVCCFTGQTGGLVALPLYLQNGLGQTPLITGLYLTAWPLSVAIAVVATRRIEDRLSSGCLCAIGGGLLSLGLAAAALWPLEGAPQPLILCVILCGLGFGLFQVSNNRNMFESAALARSGTAGGLQGTARLCGQTAGALLITLLITLPRSAWLRVSGLGSARFWPWPARR